MNYNIVFLAIFFGLPALFLTFLAVLVGIVVWSDRK